MENNLQNKFAAEEAAVTRKIAQAKESLSKKFRMSGPKLPKLPEGLGQLNDLCTLELFIMELLELPSEIGQLSNLKKFTAYGNHLTSLPEQITNLINLQTLGLSSNLLKIFPKEIFQLKNLVELRLSANQLTVLPPEIAQLAKLKDLRLKTNSISTIPTEIKNLKELENFDIRRNNISSLPPEIGQLSELKHLDVRDNPLTSLPVELGRCHKLENLHISETAKFRFPSSDIVELGTDAILRYLRAVETGEEVVFESKLLLVGEGAVGKTWLYEALNGRKSGGHRKGEGATIGIEIGSLNLPQPEDGNILMRLNCWDFAGQDINHATHQFFFSERTLFLLCWNARAGWEAGKLRKWLTNIRDRAPGAKVLLVATHCDQPHSDYPEKELRTEFEQIVATFKVSNETGEGIETLKQEIAQQAKNLPMMGLRWPKTWRAAQQAVQALRAHKPYASLNEVRSVICECGLELPDAAILLRWLHELGEVLHYADAQELSDLVIVNAQWVTRLVGAVLASSDVQNAKGILTRACLEEIWPEVEPHVRQHLLGMMEKFDLAYRIPEDQDHRCLVVERLPQNPPDYEQRWNAANAQPEVRLRYRLKAIHPGIPTWFIARCHRFTLGFHWLRGVLFGDDRHAPRHLALVVAKESERAVDFIVRGPQPWTFLPLLTDGFEDTVLKRYPGLEFERIAPCPGLRKDRSPCDYEFNLKDLEALRWPEDQGVKPEYEIRCTRCRTTHDIDKLLLGLSRAPARDIEKLDEILKMIHIDGGKTRELISKEIQEMRQFMQLTFVQEWNKEQEFEEQSCPTVFSLYPIGKETFTRKSKLHLQLYCMHPACWHSIGSDGMCEFQPHREGYITATRWIRNGLRWLKPVAVLLPSGAPLVGEYAKDIHDFAEHAKNELEFTAEIFKEIREVTDSDTGRGTNPRNQAKEVELYELKEFLDELNFPVKPYGGLRRVRTPEGHILWLCAEHAAEFNRLL